jgi:hypothetical protein
VGIEENIRVPLAENFAETSGVFRIAFGKVSVQVEVGIVAAKPGFVGGGLSRAVVGAAVQVAANAINRYDDDDRIFQNFCHPVVIAKDVVGKFEAGVNPFRLSGMDAVVDEEYRFSLLADFRRIEFRFVVDDEQVKRFATIGQPFFKQYRIFVMPVKHLKHFDGFGIGGRIIFFVF